LSSRPALVLALLPLALLPLWLPALLQFASPLTDSRPSPHSQVAAAPRPFGLPFASPPGPGTWYISQSYGNTVYAYQERRSLYASGQGMHMGLDLAAPCGTPVIAIGDGVVKSVDGPGGAKPHNLMIDHNNGFVSFYGHLRDRPELVPGQYVRRSQVVAVSGDMYGSCVASPHLHLEIRDATTTRFFNPVTLIDADWNSILLFGSAPLAFERDLDAPRRWQTLEDQPEIRLGGPLLNEFEKPWPAGGGG
jgi:murein DD-endopeptidase MepM/ murein hydrolase activator NlpD